jgi:hypothetical protein
MSSRNDSLQVFVTIALIGALLIAVIHYGCGRADVDLPNSEPPLEILR